MSAVTFDPGSTLNVELGTPGRPWRTSDIAPSPGAAITASTVLPAAGNVRSLHGWALCETTGTAAAEVRIHDGLTAAGAVFARVNLAANESTRDTFSSEGLKCVTGELFIEVISGSVEGVIFWR